jgi:uncharacterized protein YbjT (DUF2867 family)
MPWPWRKSRWTVGRPSVVLSMPKPWSALFSTLQEDGPDHRWAGPTHMCLCGCDLFALACRFHEGEVAFYFLDARCLACGAYLTAPTEDDDVV